MLGIKEKNLRDSGDTLQEIKKKSANLKITVFLKLLRHHKKKKKNGNELSAYTYRKFYFVVWLEGDE